MSRHRNVRSMNYSEEYDGYDDVYGHSVEDDYCMSPSEAAFLYDREGSKGKQKIGAFFQTVTDIAEENEGEVESKESSLSEVDRARLESCIEQMRQTIGPSVSRQDLVNVVLLYNFNVEKAINFILDSPQYKDVKPPEKKEKDVKSFFTKSPKGFAIPKLNGLNLKCPLNLSKLSPTNSNFSSLGELASSHLQKNSTEEKSFQMSNFSQNDVQTADEQSTKSSSNFGTLADLTGHHLNKVNFNKPPFDKFAIRKNVDSCDPDSSKIDQLSNDISSINLSKSKPTSIKSASYVENESVKDSIDNNWHIDLTKALRVATSAPQLRTKHDNFVEIENTESFVPAFINCETEIENPHISRFCNMDISWVLSIKNSNSKRPSKFGKVLCRRYKRPKPYFVNDERDSTSREISPFSFNTPSPDDLISRHLAQK